MNPYYPNIFKPGRIGRRMVKNRIVQGPMGVNMSNCDGSVSEQEIAYYTERAKGGVGIIELGAVAVERSGMILSNNPVVDKTSVVGSLGRLTDAIHPYGTLVIAQLVHGGARTRNFETGSLPWCVSDVDPENTSIRRLRKLSPQHELTREEIKGLVPLFVKAAKNCAAGGLDGIELHCAHSYLLCEFLSPDLNKRTDEFGGSLENRMRIILEIVRAIRKACGPEFIIGARIPGFEQVTNRIKDEEFGLIAKAMETAGCDYLSVSAGSITNPMMSMEPEGTCEGPRLVTENRIKQAVAIPVMGSGVLRTPEFCEQALEEGLVDFLIMARTLNCDPYWPEKARTGHPELIRPCLSCNNCLDWVENGTSLTCAINPVSGREVNNRERVPAEVKKKVLVIGGGLGGMQAAITAAKRGHYVSLFERDDHLGGQMVLAAIPPHKEMVSKACHWFVLELERQNVSVFLNTEVTMERILKEHPDHIIYAPGAVPFTPDIEGREHSIQSWDLLAGKMPMPVGKRVTIIGGGMVGCEAALTVAQKGNVTTIIEMLPDIAIGLNGSNKAQLISDLNENGVKRYVSTKVLCMTEDSVTCENTAGQFSIPSDVIVMAAGFSMEGKTLCRKLLESDLPVSVIGNGKVPGKFLEAAGYGYLAASVI